MILRLTPESQQAFSRILMVQQSETLSTSEKAKKLQEISDNLPDAVKKEISEEIEKLEMLKNIVDELGILEVVVVVTLDNCAVELLPNIVSNFVDEKAELVIFGDVVFTNFAAVTFVAGLVVVDEERVKFTL
ncbi:hypothetical protein FO519_009016 [Halicephalobus sp. NKZ332]|nr:hypothetical protein FO519_009016 [Halicephalobus sp. NKZ332]